MTAHALDLPPLRDTDFSAEATLAAGDVRLKLVGSADARAVEPLSSLLPRLHAEATRVGAKRVVVDLLELEFMNSSCFKSFVTWISMVRKAPVQYSISLLSNPSMLWQKRSLHALACFAADLVTIEVPS